MVISVRALSVVSEHCQNARSARTSERKWLLIGNRGVFEDKSLHNCNTASHTCSTLRTKNSRRKTANKATKRSESLESLPGTRLFRGTQLQHGSERCLQRERGGTRNI